MRVSEKYIELTQYKIQLNQYHLNCLPATRGHWRKVMSASLEAEDCCHLVEGNTDAELGKMRADGDFFNL